MRFTHVVAATTLVAASICAAQAAGSTALTPTPAAPTTTGATASDREPVGTELRSIDGTNVVMQYGHVVPSFDGWRTHQPTRDYLDLDGSWRFRFDPDAVGVDRGWQQERFDDSGWDQIAVPSAWDLKGHPDWGSYDGADFGKGESLTDGYAWYRTRVDVPKTWRERYLRLNFLAVNYAADVWVNGDFVGRHEGGHAPFALPVGDAIQPGHANVIAVRVYRRPDFQNYQTGAGPITDDKAIPWKPVDYWPYAGITRSVWLESVPSVTVAKVLVDAGAGQFDARVVVENQRGEPFHGTAVVDPGDASGAAPVSVPVDVGAGDVAVATVRTAIPDAPTWSPADPNVLTATATLQTGPKAKPVDRLTTTYGARTVAVEGSHLLVNGQPVFLKGVNWHEETAAHGAAMTVADYDHELGHVLDTNANMIRNSVYTRHPYVYDWADQHGVFVMDEPDNMWINTAQERLQTEQYGLSRAMALTMVWNEHNSPATILWCLQNESEIDGGGAPVYRAWLSDMKQAVKAVDLSDRPVTWASNTTNDPAFDLADVVGFNEYFGYFYGKNADLGPAIDAVHAKYPNKPILITENGSWSIAGTHGPDTQAGTEEWQAANFRSHWAQTTARSDYVAGYTFWLLKDYKERDGYNQAYNGISVLGMLGFDSDTKKLVYDAFRDAQTPTGTSTSGGS